MITEENDRMCNIIGYLQEHGHETFEERPFCATDALILSQLSYIDWSGIVPERKRASCGCQIKDVLGLGKEHQLVQGSMYGPQNLCLVSVCANTKRFGDVKMFAYMSCCKRSVHLQFAALSFLMPDERICVVFRGTDESVNGWQENFSMLYRDPVPAQEMAVKYVEEIIVANSRNRIVVSGHSKGGNLAVYAAAKCRSHLQKHISRVYNFDGPGFSEAFLRDAGYVNVAGKIRKYVVPESIVGIFLNNDGKTFMVESAGHGMLQHDPYQWEIKDGRLKRAGKYDLEKRRQGELLNEKILNLPREDARKLIESFFTTLQKRGVADITQMKLEDSLAVLRGFAGEGIYNRDAISVLGTLIVYFVPAQHNINTGKNMSVLIK